MDNILQYLINLSIFIPFVIVLIIFSIKLSKLNLENIGIYKHTKVIERTNIKKDTDVFILQIGDEGCVFISSSSKIEKIKDLNKDEINFIKNKQNEMKKSKPFKFDMKKLNIKNKKIKEK